MYKIFPENWHLECQDVSYSEDENNLEIKSESEIKITKFEALELNNRLKLYCTQGTQIEANVMINFLRKFENKVYDLFQNSFIPKKARILINKDNSINVILLYFCQSKIFFSFFCFQFWKIFLDYRNVSQNRDRTVL